MDTSFINNTRQQNDCCSSTCVLLTCCSDKTPGPKAVHGRKFLWAYSCRGTRLHHVWEAWQQATGMGTGADSWETITSDPSRSRTQASWKGHRLLTLRAFPSDIFPSARPYWLTSPDNTTSWGTYGKHFHSSHYHVEEKKGKREEKEKKKQSKIKQKTPKTPKPKTSFLKFLTKNNS